MIAELVKEVDVQSIRYGDPVYVKKYPSVWRCIGVGTSAAVFQPKDQPHLAVKVYTHKHLFKLSEEVAVYKRLENSPLFPRFYGHGENFLLIEFKPGRNIYDCLLQGIFIPTQVILDVEEAIAYAKGKGLKPADIHAKNILLHEGRGFLIDVSDYGKEKDCKRWDNLKLIYNKYYLDIYKPGLNIPSWLLETIRKWYKGNSYDGNITAFAEGIKRMFFTV